MITLKVHNVCVWKGRQWEILLLFMLDVDTCLVMWCFKIILELLQNVQVARDLHAKRPILLCLWNSQLLLWNNHAAFL